MSLSTSGLLIITVTDSTYIWPSLLITVTGSTEVDGPESDQEELDHSSSRDGSDSTLDNFVEQLECHHAPTETKEEYKKESVASIGNLSLGFSGNY